MNRHLRVTKSETMPTSIIVVGCELEQSAVAPAASSQDVPARVWHRPKKIQVSRWRYERDEKTRRADQCCQSKEEFWSFVRTSMRHGVTTWLFCWRANETMPALGLLEQMDKGELTMQAVDLEGSPEHGGYRKRPWSGLLVTENPPWLAVLRFAKHSGTLKIVGLENYGFRPPTIEHGAMEHCLAAETAVESYRHLLWRHDLGAWQSTAGSQAMHSYRRKFMIWPIEKHRNETINELELDGYFGGRCECFRMGLQEERMYHLDATSFYSAAVVGQQLPIQLFGYHEAPSLRDLTVLAAKLPVIAEVKVDTTLPIFPYYLDREGEKPIVCWPVGRFQTILCGPELALALNGANVVECLRVASYAGAPAFDKWVQSLWDIRQGPITDTHPSLVPVLKALMVGLYGKFGQRKREWQYEPTRANEHKWDMWYEAGNVAWRTLAGHSYKQVQKGLARHAVPALAAYVTSFGRAALWNLVYLAGKENVAYVGTDSLWTTARGYEALRHAQSVGQNEIGSLKEIERADDCDIKGIGHYVANGRVKRAGVPTGVVGKTGNLVSWLEAERFSSALFSKRMPEAKMIRRRLPTVDKYRHGKVNQWGVVNPLVVKEW